MLIGWLMGIVRSWIPVFILGLLSVAGCAPSVTWIDTHTHLEGGPGMGPRADPERVVGPALAMMDRQGLQKILIMPPPSPREQLSSDYEVLSRIVKENPQRFAFLGGGRSLNPLIQDAISRQAVTPEIQRRFEQRAEEIIKAGAVGFGEMTALHLSFVAAHPFEEAPPDHPLFLLLADIAARHHVAIDLHMEAVVQETPLPGGFSSPPNARTLHENIRAFERLLAHNRNARIVWVHVGWDNTRQMTVPLLQRLLQAHPNLYMSIKIDQATPGRSLPDNNPLDSFGRIRAEWLELIRSFPDRFVIGTDSMYEISRQVEMVSQGPLSLLAQLPPDLAQKIGYENAIRIYQLQK